LTAGRPKRISIDRLDCEGIAGLMENGFTLKEALSLLEDRKNRDCFREIQNRLENGEKISEFFHQYCPKVYRSYYSCFAACVPFLESLRLSMAVVAEEEQQKRMYRKGLLYPCLLFLASLAGVVLFNELCFPALLSLADSFRISGPDYRRMQGIIRFATAAAAAVILVLAVLFAYYSRPQNQVRGYQIASRWHVFPVLRQHASADFVRFFRQCQKTGIRTREAMVLLKSMEQKPLVRFLAESIDRSLQQGQKMETAMQDPHIDSTLARFFTIAVYSSNLERMLDGYLEMSCARIKRHCRMITVAVQTASYLSIGAVIIVVYQLLMMPLSILAQL
jgi:competence protein ComGB